MAQNQAAPAAPINPADFTTVIDNPYMTLTPGTTFISETPDGSSVDTMTVTRNTRVLDGVTCVAVSDVTVQNGELLEKTTDYYAEDKSGNVWYFGETTAEYENGQVVSTEGTWLSGVNGAAPGIIMEANPQVGDSYDQEHAPGVAEDHAAVTGNGKLVDVPYGSFDNALQTLETTALEPGAAEHKYYVKGVGFVLSVDQVTGEVEQLVSVKIDGMSGGDKLTGYNGHDTLFGHAGNDILDGGKDSVSDVLHGGLGNDWIAVGTADQAYGDIGNDTLRLFDNLHFGLISGGSEDHRDLATSEGDTLAFTGGLDLSEDAVASRITGIETLSMTEGKGHDSLTLNVYDVLHLGDGTFDPSGALHTGHALKVEGSSGDVLTLSGGGWHEIAAANAPAHFDVYATPTAGGHEGYVLVQDTVTVHTV